MPSVIVTGGAGFIGANFVRFRPPKTDAHIVIVDNLTYAGNLASLDGPLGDLESLLSRQTYGSAPALEDIFRAYQPDAIVNFAAESHVDRSIDDPRPFVETNIVGVSVLLESRTALLE
jgi:dTDP-glucose 4,6-dehydratase